MKTDTSSTEKLFHGACNQEFLDDIFKKYDLFVTKEVKNTNAHTIRNTRGFLLTFL